MDSDSPIEARTAGQPTLSSGNATFTFDGTKAEFASACDRGCGSTAARYRGGHHPPARGDGHAA